jgi:hypothetical protein
MRVSGRRSKDERPAKSSRGDYKNASSRISSRSLREDLVLDAQVSV